MQMHDNFWKILVSFVSSKNVLIGVYCLKPFKLVELASSYLHTNTQSQKSNYTNYYVIGLTSLGLKVWKVFLKEHCPLCIQSITGADTGD